MKKVIEVDTIILLGGRRNGMNTYRKMVKEFGKAILQISAVSQKLLHFNYDNLKIAKRIELENKVFVWCKVKKIIVEES